MFTATNENKPQLINISKQIKGYKSTTCLEFKFDVVVAERYPQQVFLVLTKWARSFLKTLIITEANCVFWLAKYLMNHWADFD